MQQATCAKGYLMNTQKLLRRHAVVVLTTGLFLVQQVAQACPGCRQAAGMGDGASGSMAVNSLGIAYGLSIIGLLLTVFCLIGGLGFVAYRNCQIIAARQRAMLEAEDAANFGGLQV